MTPCATPSRSVDIGLCIITSVYSEDTTWGYSANAWEICQNEPGLSIPDPSRKVAAFAPLAYYVLVFGVSLSPFGSSNHPFPIA
jgi:hypothetical protein